MREVVDGGRPQRIELSRFSCLAATALAGLALAACGGSERSTEAFCDTLASEKQRILSQFEANSNPATDDELVTTLAGLGASVQALGELRTYFEKLADVAPEEIRAQAEIVAEQYEKQFDDLQDAASDPLGGLAAGLVNSVAVSGQMNAVHSFARANCGEGL